MSTRTKVTPLTVALLGLLIGVSIVVVFAGTRPRYRYATVTADWIADGSPVTTTRPNSTTITPRVECAGWLLSQPDAPRDVEPFVGFSLSDGGGWTTVTTTSNPCHDGLTTARVVATAAISLLAIAAAITLLKSRGTEHHHDPDDLATAATSQL